MDAREEAYQAALKAQRQQVSRGAGGDTVKATPDRARVRAAPQAANRQPVMPAALRPLAPRAAHSHVCAEPADLALPGQAASDDLHVGLIREAIGNLGPISRKSLIELRSYTKPPRAVCLVLDCLCILLGVPVDATSAKLQLANPALLIERMHAYADFGVPRPSVITVASKYVNDPDFDEGAMAKVAPAARWLCAWCVAVVEASREAQHRATLWLPASVKSQASPRQDSVSNPTALPSLSQVPIWDDDFGAADAQHVSGGGGSSSARAVRTRPSPPSEPRPWQTARRAPRPHLTHNPSMGNQTPRPSHAIMPLLKLARTVTKLEDNAVDAEPKPASFRAVATTLPAIGRLESGWVQTRLNVDAAGEQQAAALRTMLDSMSHAGGTVSEAIALARRAAAPPPPTNPNVEKLGREVVFSMRRAALLGGGAGKTNAELGLLWSDCGMVASQRKRNRAETSKWRAQRIAWSRASGLRRQLVQGMAEQERQRERKSNAKAAEAAHRRMLWQIEDSAAMRIQDGFIRQKQLRKERAEQKALLAVRLASHAKEITASQNQVSLTKGALVNGTPAQSPKPTNMAQRTSKQANNGGRAVRITEPPEEAPAGRFTDDKLDMRLANDVTANQDVTTYQDSLEGGKRVRAALAGAAPPLTEAGVAASENAARTRISWPEDAEERERRFGTLAWTAGKPLGEVSEMLAAGLEATLECLNKKLLDVSDE